MKTIIAPTDFSNSASNAVDYAVELAKYFSAKIILVNAYPIPETHYEMGGSFELLSTLKDVSLDNLEQLRDKILINAPQLNIECYSDMGHPYGVIDAVVRDKRADLVVMGIVGTAGKLKERFIGSTAVEVARNLEVPTFIIPEGVTYHEVNKISFACDLDKTEKTDLVYVAKYFAEKFHAELEIVNVDDPEKEITIDKAVTNLFVERKLETVKHDRTQLSGKDVQEELENYFNSHYTDIVMVSPKKHNIFYNLFHKSVTKELAFHAHKPILAIH
ncbi:MAG: UspA protein [Bacteroidota bacterium]|jgi:nucleotide-binding universal stress UspA family protein|nr:UspA protein [Bacteroidota bacterium]